MDKLLCVLLMIVVVGCTGMSRQDGKPLEKWTVFESSRLKPKQLKPSQAEVVFIREPGVVAGGAVDIFINGDYLTSLLDGGYKPVVVCATRQRINSRFSNQRDFFAHQVGATFDFPASQLTYIRVKKGLNGQPELERLDSNAGAISTGKLGRLQSQTISRVSTPARCDGVSIHKSYTLETEALFGFDKSDYASILPAGKQALQQIASKIKQEKTKIGSILISGYSDAIGSDVYNKKLSERRANTVRQVLKKIGVAGITVDAIGLGKHDLVVTNCHAKHPKNNKARIACEQPNRRVEITLYGTQVK